MSRRSTIKPLRRDYLPVHRIWNDISMYRPALKLQPGALVGQIEMNVVYKLNISNFMEWEFIHSSQTIKQIMELLSFQANLRVSAWKMSAIISHCRRKPCASISTVVQTVNCEEVFITTPCFHFLCKSQFHQPGNYVVSIWLCDFWIDSQS